MILTIFTGLHNGRRFYDSFIDGDGYDGDYEDCDRYKFLFSEYEIDAAIYEKAQEIDDYGDLIAGIPVTDIRRFIRGAYLNSLDRELIADKITEELRELVIYDFVMDCKDEVKRKYEV